VGGEEQNNDAGTCYVELTFGSGGTSSIDIKVISRWVAFESDPHGCGQAFIPLTESGSDCVPSACQFSLPDRTCDAGAGGAPGQSN
jgi:hypothetical protein